MSEQVNQGTMGIGKLEQRMSIVFDGMEEEAASRGGGSGEGAIMGGENRGMSSRCM